jgi:hypothetical protein
MRRFRFWAAAAGLCAVAVLAAGCGSSSGRPAASTSVPATAAPVPMTVTMTSSSGQAEVLLRPTGSVRGLVVFMHGFDSDQDQILGTSGFAPLRVALLSAGYAIVASDAHGNNFGNPASIQDQLDAVHDARAHLPRVRDVSILAFSMGGLDALLTASSHNLPGLRSVALISPAVDQTSFLTGPFANAITAAFGDPPVAQVPALVRRSDPLAQPVATYAGYAYHFWHSPGDSTVPVSQSQKMTRYLATGGISAQVTPLTGDHGDLTALRPRAVVQLFSDAA